MKNNTLLVFLQANCQQVLTRVYDSPG